MTKAGMTRTGTTRAGMTRIGCKRNPARKLRRTAGSFRLVDIDLKGHELNKVKVAYQPLANLE